MLALMVARSASAASLQQVSNWGVSGLPSDVTMYIYVPNNVAANPPILTLVHYCGGTASAVFGQAQGGGIVSAADQYGFIMVVPSSGRCWDVESDKAWKRDGGGDSHAIKQMVTYAIGKYGANADRVYSTGDSSGAMMTELLLALYPDVFKAGAAFAGMPAGCRGASESGTAMGYSGACAGGTVTHTAPQWGDIVRKMDPGYTGHRPRVQLFHGDADTTIRYPNFTEAIKEWTDVLGVATNPTSTTMNVPLGTHQATRQQWQSPCGYLVLEGFTSLGGDHGPSDALFKAQYVIPFLGLDKTGAVDPEIQQCGNGGTGGNSGADGGVDGAARGGAGGSGGRAGGGGSGSAGSGGSGGLGGNSGRGGSNGGGGNGGTTPMAGTGGGAAGTTGTAGGGGASVSTGGSVGTGGSVSTGGGGAPGRGGTQGSDAGGSAGTGSGGASSTSGAAGSSMVGPDSSGCSCALGSANPRDTVAIVPLALGFALAALALTRKRRRINRPRGIR
jgi:poly(hydroxyalkanoate) depolymerase family esterase